MSKKISVLVIGCGNMGASHATAYHNHDGFEICGLVSRGKSKDELNNSLKSNYKLFDATKHLHLTMPTGRRYDFKPELNSMGKPKMPRTRILNYPVQGLGADLMSIVRVSIANRLRGRKNVDLINTVHDSVMIDYDDNLNDTDELVSIVEQAFHDIPANFYKLFGTKFNLPTRVDVQVGNNWGEMK